MMNIVLAGNITPTIRICRNRRILFAGKDIIKNGYIVSFLFKDSGQYNIIVLVTT
jgi:hypothetical protein